MNRTRWFAFFLVSILLVGRTVLGQADSSKETPPIDLSGTWAHVQVYSQYSTFPIVGRTQNVTTVILHVQTEQTESTVVMRDAYCATTIDNGTILASTVIPDAFLSSLSSNPRIATLTETDDGIRFVQEWYTEIRGARLDDPEDEPLPTSPDDPRVSDQDGDGKPGMTVKVKILGMISGETYVVQRVHYRLIGAVTSPDTIEGLIEWTNEQITIGASASFFASDIQATVDPVPENSYFIAKRISPEMDCGTLQKTWKDLFEK
jgi:hypothetical protein